MPAVSRSDLQQRLADLERHRSELVSQLAPHQLYVRQSIFATIRAGLASQLLSLVRSTLYRVDERDYNGFTPLHMAAHEGRQDMVHILLSEGADPKAVDHFGRTPRDLAVANRHSNIARLLLHAMTSSLVTANGDVAESAPSSAHLLQQHALLADAESSTATSHNHAALSDPDASPPQSERCVRDSPAIAMQSSPSMRFGQSVGDCSLEPPMRTLVVGDDAMLDCDEDHVSNSSAVPSERFSRYCTISDDVCLVVCMVGLPGRGKSFISKRIARYLNWKGVPTRVFNAGNYRRQLLGATDTAKADFYDPSNEDARAKRELMAQLACEDLVKFLETNTIGVGILDATNTTVERRRHLLDYFHDVETTVLRKPIRVLFIESVCTDERIITENILRAKCGNDDFSHVSDPATVIGEFRNRISQYEKVYESVRDDESVSFIKIINIKEHIVLSRISGGLASRIVFFLLNLHPVAHPIYVMANAETEGNRDRVFGGSGLLTERGKRAAVELRRFVDERCADIRDTKLLVLHATNPYVMATVAPLQELADRGLIEMVKTRALDDINFGKVNGDTLLDFITKHPKRSRMLLISNDDTWTTSMNNSQPTVETRCSSLVDEHFRRVPTVDCPVLNYQAQFPSGESCRQVNVRLESAILRLLRCGCPALVVAPDIPAQGLVAFLTDAKPELSPYFHIPRHAIVELHKMIQLHHLAVERET